MSEDIYVESKQNKNIVQVTHTNVKESEKLAETYAKNAEKSSMVCQNCVNIVQNIITEYENEIVENTYDDTQLRNDLAEVRGSIPAKTSDLTNDSGYITGINSSDVTTALGYTPYNSSNPNGYTSNTGTVTSVNNTSPDSNGDVSITVPTVPANISAFTNDSGYITGINSSDITTALGYTPTSPANVDGQWNYTFTVIHSATALGTFPYYLNATKGQEAGESSSNIFDILPNDNYKYELLVMAGGRVKVLGPSLVGIATTVWANPFDSDHNILALRGDGTHSLYNNNTLVIPIDTDRKIQVAVFNTKPDLIGVTILGYRRIGTNL